MTDQNDRPSYRQDPQDHGRGPYGAVPQGQGHGHAQGRPDYGPTGQGPYGQGYGPSQGGWDQQAGSRYGTLPYEAYGQQRLEEPPKYRHLLMATLISLGVFLVSAIPGFMMFGNTDEFRAVMEEQMAAQGQTLAGEEAQAFDQMLTFFTGAGMVMMALFTLLFAGLYLLVYFGLRKRRNWARVTGIVFAILSVVATLPGLLLAPLMGGAGMFSLVLSLLSIAVNVWWLVLAFNGRISRYLQQRTLVG